jgi:hypothetical protein
MYGSETKYIQSNCRKNCKENNYSEDLGTNGRVWAGNVVHVTMVINSQAPYDSENFWTS